MYDLIIIGAGPGGEAAALAAAERGMKTALVEEKHPGGTCLNRGCIPAKTLLHTAELYHELQTGTELGISAETPGYDMAAINRRRDAVVSQLRTGLEAHLKASGVDLIYGRAHLLSAGEIEVTAAEGKSVLQAAKILLATGAEPFLPPVEGIELPGVVTSDALLEGAAPDYRSLVIIGGGVIGVELASFYSTLGCTVTIIEAAERILPLLDREISQNLTMLLKKRGVAVHTGCTLTRIEQAGNGLRCCFSGKTGEQTLAAEGVLVAVGRRAKLDGLFAEGVSIACQRGILVNERFETSLPGVYAIGDATEGSIQLAHAATAQGGNAVAFMAGDTSTTDLSLIPSCVYTSPEIASVGLTADEAKARGIAAVTGKAPMTANGKTVITRQDRSFIKLVFDAQTEALLGAQLMCARASDMIGELALATANGLTLTQLAALVRPHPSFAEAIGAAVRDAQKRAAAQREKGGD